MSARSGETLDYTQVFDKGCVDSRLHELTMHFISEFAFDDMRARAKAQRLAGEPTTNYPLNQAETIEKFTERAKVKALKTVEQERKNLVDYQTPYIKMVLERVLKRLRYMVYNVDEKGKVSKVKIVMEKIAQADNRGQWETRDVQYVGNRDIERFESICRILEQASQFNGYVPYFNEEVSKLWKEVSELGNLEHIRKEDLKNATTEETQTAQKVEA